MSSKKDFETVFLFINNIIKNLSVSEYENILNGSATLKYVEKSLTVAEKQQFDLILKNILNQVVVDNNLDKSMDILINNVQTKNQLINFCNYLNIDVKSKYTKEDIQYKILLFVNENRESLINKLNKDVSDNQHIEQVALRLSEFDNKENALEFLFTNKLLDHKSNVLLLAKILEVNVKKESTVLEMLDRIVDSVVGSKLRSMAIRGNFKKK